MGSPTAAGTVHGLEARRAHTRGVVILSDKKLAALLRLLPQDASGVFKDRREPDSIGIVMPVGWAETGAPENEAGAS